MIFSTRFRIYVNNEKRNFKVSARFWGGIWDVRSEILTKLIACSGQSSWIRTAGESQLDLLVQPPQAGVR